MKIKNCQECALYDAMGSMLYDDFIKKGRPRRKRHYCTLYDYPRSIPKLLWKNILPCPYKTKRTEADDFGDARAEYDPYVKLGLRKSESPKFERFFEIVQDAARAIGCTYFLDAGDGREFEADSLEGEDLMGWLIPDEKLDAFQDAFYTDDISDDWSEFYKWAIWENPDNPLIKFE